jgi:predicted transcriptional regulator
VIRKQLLRLTGQLPMAVPTFDRTRGQLVADQDQATRQAELTAIVADIVSAYVGNNPVQPGDLPELIGSVYKSIGGLSNGRAVEEPQPLAPAVPVKKSVTPDYIVCLEDGKKFKSLKRHLGVHYNLTPDEYRAKWGLPASYPMVAPNYAAARSSLAKKMGLGRKPGAAKARRKKA